MSYITGLGASIANVMWGILIKSAVSYYYIKFVAWTLSAVSLIQTENTLFIIK